MFKSYFTIFLRNLPKNKLSTAINTLGLSIGISAALVIYLIVRFDLTFDNFHPGKERIYRVVTNFSYSGLPGYNAGVCDPLPWAVKKEVSGLEAAAPIYRLFQPNVTVSASTTVPGNSGEPGQFKLQDNVVFADGAFFRVFAYRWLAGSAQTALNEPGQVVLTSEQAKKYFPGLGYDQMIGRVLHYDTLSITVSGIVQTFSENTDLTMQAFISFSTAFAQPGIKNQLRLGNWGGTDGNHQLFVKLAPGVDGAGVARQMNEILAKNNPPKSKDRTQAFALQALKEIHFDARYGTFNGRVADRVTLYELCGIALFLLLLGGINFINLNTVASAQRAKEIGIRKTMGSSRGQLIGQFLAETFFLTLLAVLISTAVTPFVLRWFSDFIPSGVHLDLVGQLDILVFLVVLTIAVSCLSGFYPALVLSGFSLRQVIHPYGARAWLRKTLTVVQFVIAQFFIMATLLVSKQIHYALTKDLGFKKDAIILVSSPWKDRQQGRNLLFINKLRAIPQVDIVSAGRDAPTSDDPHSTEGSYRDGKKEVKIEDLGEKFGDENYIKVYHIPLLAGRNLRPDDTGRAFIINQTLARRMGFSDANKAVGKTITNFNGDINMQIVGVVEDFNQESIQAPIAPLAILTSTDLNFNGTFHIALKPQEAGSQSWQTAIAAIGKAWKEVYPGDDFGYRFFDESIARLYTNEQHISSLLRWAAGLSVLISCMGLMGLAVYTSTQRTKEIGIRKVLGATVVQIIALLSVDFVRLVGLAFVVAVPISWWATHQWLQNYADHTALSWWLFAVTGFFMLVLTLLVLGLRAGKAAMANPVESLRRE